MLPEKFTLQIKKNVDGGWWVITCTEDDGLYLFGPELKECLMQVPSAFILLTKAREVQ